MAVKVSKGQICTGHYIKNLMSPGVQKVHTNPLFWPYAAVLKQSILYEIIFDKQ